MPFQSKGKQKLISKSKQLLNAVLKHRLHANLQKMPTYYITCSEKMSMLLYVMQEEESV